MPSPWVLCVLIRVQIGVVILDGLRCRHRPALPAAPVLSGGPFPSFPGWIVLMSLLSFAFSLMIPAFPEKQSLSGPYSPSGQACLWTQRHPFSWSRGLGLSGQPSAAAWWFLFSASAPRWLKPQDSPKTPSYFWGEQC